MTNITNVYLPKFQSLKKYLYLYAIILLPKKSLYNLTTYQLPIIAITRYPIYHLNITIYCIYLQVDIQYSLYFHPYFIIKLDWYLFVAYDFISRIEH